MTTSPETWVNSTRQRMGGRGPEWLLVRRFLAAWADSNGDDVRTTLLLEPRLPSGFPDVVVVEWRPDVVGSWPEERASLTTDDLRILHALSGRKRLPLSEIPGQQGKALLNAIDRLERAQTLTVTNKGVRRKPLSELLAVVRIAAIEAKMGRPSDVLAQAVRNTWFASESHALVDNHATARSIADNPITGALGVGVLAMPTESEPTRSAPARSLGLPRSYASWMINDALHPNGRQRARLGMA